MEVDAFIRQIEKRFGNKAATAFLIFAIAAAIAGGLTLMGAAISAFNSWLTETVGVANPWEMLIILGKYVVGFLLLIAVSASLSIVSAARRMERLSSDAWHKTDALLSRAMAAKAEMDAMQMELSGTLNDARTALSEARALSDGIGDGK